MKDDSTYEYRQLVTPVIRHGLRYDHYGKYVKYIERQKRERFLHEDTVHDTDTPFVDASACDVSSDDIEKSRFALVEE